jgi:hypothetical protein
MVRLEVQRTIVERALRHNPKPFFRQGTHFEWHGSTRVVSKATHRAYEPEVSITVDTQPRLADQIAACLCKDSIRFEDLVIASMVDTRLRGRIRITGLPKGDADHDLVRFLKQTETVQA